MIILCQNTFAFRKVNKNTPVLTGIKFNFLTHFDKKKLFNCLTLCAMKGTILVSDLRNLTSEIFRGNQ